MRQESGGYFVDVTIFDNVTNDMKIAQEEIFGPVLSVITFETEVQLPVSVCMIVCWSGISHLTTCVHGRLRVRYSERGGFICLWDGQACVYVCRADSTGGEWVCGIVHL